MNAINNTEKEWIRHIIIGPPLAKKEKNVPHKTAEKHPTVRETSKKKSFGFRDVAGMDDLKLLVTDGFINVLNHRECALAYGIYPPSVLLYGPAGCGKTFFVEKMAEEVGVNFIKVVPDDLASVLVHGTQQKIGEIFQMAERKAPTIIFFDEFDAMVPQRTNDDRSYQNGETNEFLCMLNNASQKGIYVFAATNHPERIDKAVLRTGRIDEMIYVDLPDGKMRESLFQLALSKVPTAEDIDCKKLAELTKGYNCSDITYVVSVASRKMFNESIRESDKTYHLITQHLLEDSIAHKSPSVSSRELQNFERLRSEFSPRDPLCRHTTLGFHL